MTFLPSRRAALGLVASAAAGAAFPLVRSAPAAAQLVAPPGLALPIPGGGAPAAGLDGLRISRVAVDASALRSPVNALLADMVTQELSADLATVFADLRTAAGGRGVTLLARVSSIYLPYYPGGHGRGGTGPDNIEGVGLLVSGDRVLSETPLYTTLPASYSGPWFEPGRTDRRRVASICYQFAYWLRRDMGI